jgi:tetratricopeptide (TPR) repeat protein
VAATSAHNSTAAAHHHKPEQNYRPNCDNRLPIHKNLQSKPVNLHTITPRLAAIGVVLFAPLALHGQELGSITFPNSGSSAAQSKFVEGVKDLHSFEFDEAADAFRKAQQIDPSFALAYWGEAMSYNHPLWEEVDVPAARKALERLAPSLDARSAKAGAPKEKAYRHAVDQLFYAPSDKLVRDNAYSDAMAQMYKKWPDDHEVAIFYALSLLGTVRPGDQGFRRQALAASIALNVFQQNPNHPGAAHFIIHSFDDPDHAILALPAARAYAKIAPAAPHALAYALAYFPSARDVGGCGGIEYRRVQSGHRSERENAPRGGPRRLSHTILARIRESDDGQVR